MDVLVEQINAFFKSVSDPLEPLSPQHPYLLNDCPVPHQYIISVEAMERRLLKVKTNKAAGSDGIEDWVMHDFSHVLADPLASIANAS